MYRSGTDSYRSWTSGLRGGRTELPGDERWRRGKSMDKKPVEAFGFTFEIHIYVSRVQTYSKSTLSLLNASIFQVKLHLECVEKLCTVLTQCSNS